MKLKNIVALVSFSALCWQANGQAKNQQNGQDDLLSALENETKLTSKKEYVTATFKSIRIGNSHSIENTPKGNLDFRISHRFGTLNSGVENFFGMDNATIRLGFDYGVTDWLAVGVGRSSYYKEYDGYLKTKILRQTENNSMPLSLSYVGSISVRTSKVTMPEGQEYFFSNRLAFVNQLLLAKKISNKFSLQIMPTHVHYNLVEAKKDPNDVIALGVGGRMKLSNRVSLTAEYFYQLPSQQLPSSTNSLTLGFDIETGGHVFQLLFTNSTGITERNFIGQNTGTWKNGDIHFGFNISRVFTIVAPKGFEDSKTKIW